MRNNVFFTDWRYSTGTLKERVQYSAYGQALHRWPGDFDRNDAVTAGGDQSAMTTKLSTFTTADRTLGGSAYDADYDLNRDGVVDSNDATILSGLVGKASVGAGQISDASSSGPQNTIGYAGYVFSSELTQYHVRHRWYEPALGRWTTRDPAGYVDGMSLYEYAGGRALNAIDPSGLDWRNVDGTGGSHGNGCGGGGPPGPQPSSGDWFDHIIDFGTGVSDVLSLGAGPLARRGIDALLGTDISSGVDMGSDYYTTGEVIGVVVSVVTPAAFEALAEEGAARVAEEAAAEELEASASDACAEGQRACFAADTWVLTDRGAKPIQNIQPGDLVWSVDVEHGTVDLREVMQTFERRAPETVVVHVGDDTIRCTPEHPFWVEGNGWTEAQDLYDGALLRDAQGLVQRASCVELVRTEIAVYNLEVERGHTYFVGRDHLVLVHNNCATGGSPSIHPSEVAGKTPAEIDAIANEKGLIPKGPDPMNGRGSYVDPVTGEQRILSHPNADTPHAHVNDPSGTRLDINGNPVPPESPGAHIPIGGLP
jgi:RHS repeat-associated protein